MAKLTVTRGKLAGTEFALEGRTVFDLGSAPTTAFRLEDPGVAPNHCRLVREDAKFTIYDTCGQGVRVNGQKVAHVALKPGDEIAVGNALLRFDGVGASTSGVRSPVASPGAKTPAPTNALASAPDASQANAIVYCLDGNDKGKTWPLVPSRDIFSVGRGVGADVVILDIKASREHCRLVRRGNEGSGYVLVDLGSTNGTKLNGKKVKPSSTTVLNFGDQVRIGSSILELRASGVATSGPTTRLPPGSTPAVPGVPAAISRNATTQPSTTLAVPTGTGGFAAKGADGFDLDFDFGNDPSPPTVALDPPVPGAPPPAAPPPPPPTPAKVTARVPAPPRPPVDDEEEAQASLRTFVFEDQPQDYAQPVPKDKLRDAETHPERRGSAAPPQPAPPAPPAPPRKTGKMEPGDALRTFVFDEPSFEADGPTSELSAPPATKKPHEPPPPRKTQEPRSEEIDAAFRTFVFDETPGFEEPRAEPEPAAPPERRPEPPTEEIDAAFRTFVFDEAPTFDDQRREEPAPPPKGAAPPPPPPRPPMPPLPPPSKPAPPLPPAPPPRPAKPKADAGDAALRTFVFDDAPTFEEPKPPEPPVKTRPPEGKGSTARYADPTTETDPEIDEAGGGAQHDVALRTFIFDETPSFDEAASFKNVEVDVPDVSKDSPKKKPAPPAPADDDDDRPSGHKTLLLDGEGGDELDQPGSEGGDVGFRTLIFDDPPPDF